jgi:outer membrane protein assembly factor BamB
MLSASLLVAAVSWTGVDASSEAAWPQWRGPRRDGVSTEKKLLQDWPEGGPALKWKFADAGFGYGDVAVLGDDLYLLGKFPGDGESIARLDAKTGQLVHRAKIDSAPNKYLTQWGGGPRSTPTVEGDLVWALTSDGTLACFDRRDLKEKWKLDLKEKFGSKTPTWGYAESPLIDGDKVVVMPGGKECVVALNKMTGEVVWKSEATGEPQQYASLVPMEVGGTRTYVTQGAKSLFAVDAATGNLAWKFGEIGRRTAVIPTPVVSGNRVYITAGYQAGCESVEIAKAGTGFEAKKVYVNKNMMNHHGGVVLLDGHIYGHSDSRTGGWTCQKLEDGSVVWKNNDAGKGSIGCADGRLYCFEERVGGACILIEASTAGWKEHGRLKLPENSGLQRGQGQVWAHPVIAGGKLYLRDLDLLYAYDIAAK